MGYGYYAYGIDYANGYGGDTYTYYGYGAYYGYAGYYGSAYGSYNGFYDYVGGGRYLNDPAFYDPGFYMYVPGGYGPGYYAPLNPNYNFIGGDAGYYGYGADYGAYATH